MSASKRALDQFVHANNIIQEDPIFTYDSEQQKQEQAGRPWKNDPHYFKKVKISAIALIKMVIHAKSGGDIEVMGSLQGKILGDTMIVMDSFILPVEGTETRVNAGGEANEYMVGRLENLVGWYHSHPGYGCWLSGIDVNTQSLNQQFQDPWLAIKRTMAAGKVEIGAFRTYPKDYKPPDQGPSEYQSIPLEKIEDFGVHCKQYYQLEISFFKSHRDTHLLEKIWSKYWMNTLAASPLITNRAYNTSQISDLANKIEQTESLGRSAFSVKKGEDSALSKLVRDVNKLSNEYNQGLLQQVIKNQVFSFRNEN